jgi:hypothetical protein
MPLKAKVLMGLAKDFMETLRLLAKDFMETMRLSYQTC